MKKLALLTTILFMLIACNSSFDENILSLSESQVRSISENEWISLNNGAYVMSDGSDYLLEGDIVLTKEQVNLLTQLQTRSGFIKLPDYRWPNDRIYYTTASDFAKTTDLDQAIKHIEGYTNLRFFKRTTESNFIEFVNDSKSTNSQLGMVGGKQLIKVAPWAQWYSIVHEIGHAIGLIHEHTRYDRDDYITVHWDNIPSEKAHNYDKYNPVFWGISNVTTPFDYESIMIYASKTLKPDCNDESKPVITKKDGSLINPTYRLSQEDIISINKLYPGHIFISGDESILLPTYSGTYLLLGNVPKYANIQWKVSPEGSANIIKGQGTYVATLDIVNNMIKTLEATVTYPITGEVKKTSFNIRASQAPIVTDINVSQYCQIDGDYTLQAFTTDPTATCTWTCEGVGKAVFHELCYPEDASFIDYPNLFTEVSFDQKGTYDITVNATNKHGSYTYTKHGVYINESVGSGYFSITPNPVINTNKIEIILDSKQKIIEKCNITIYKGKDIIYENESTEKRTQIDVSSFSNGRYKVRLNREGQVYQQELYISK